MRKILSTFAHAHNPNSLRMRKAFIIPYGTISIFLSAGLLIFHHGHSLQLIFVTFAEQNPCALPTFGQLSIMGMRKVLDLAHVHIS